MKTKMMVFGMIVIIAIVSVAMGTAHAQFTLPSLVPYMGWYKVKVTEKMYHFDSQAAQGERAQFSTPAYLAIDGAGQGTCCPEYSYMEGVLFTPNSSGDWDMYSNMFLRFDFFAGSGVSFVATNVYTDTNRQFEGTILIQGKPDDRGFMKSAKLKTLGGYTTKTTSDSPQRWAGSIILSGSRVDPSKVPPEINPDDYSLYETNEIDSMGRFVHKVQLKHKE